MTDFRQFVVSKLRLEAAPGVRGIRLYRAHPASGLSAWLGDAAPPPYWAWGWAGGTVLARHVLDHPDVVRDRRVFDAGTGSGIVAIAAALAGAAQVTAADIDPLAVEAVCCNAQANDVAITAVHGDATSTVPEVDLILAGDVVYAEHVAVAMIAWFERCAAAGIEVLVGDPGRTFLPRERLESLAEYVVPDFGSGNGTAAVYRFR